MKKIKVEDFLIQCLDSVLKRYRIANRKTAIVKETQRKEVVRLWKEYRSINEVTREVRWGHGTVARIIYEEIHGVKK